MKTYIDWSEYTDGGMGDAYAGISKPSLIEAMDLCVSCKGCKRECENDVDMARIKTEYLTQLNAQTGLSLRARLFVGLPGVAASSACFRRLTARWNRYRLLAQLAERLLVICALVKLPEVVSEPLAVSDLVAGDRQVILFVDTFSRHYSPQIAHAAIEVLEVAGYQVRLAMPEDEAADELPLCCDRTYLAQGMWIRPAKRRTA